MDLRTPTATKALGGVGLLLLTGAGWLFVLGPETARLGEVQQQVVDARDQNDNLGLQLASLRKQAAELDATRVTARELAEKFPPTADQPGLFRQVTEAAAQAGIGARNVKALTPTPPTVGVTDPSVGVQPQAAPEGVARQTVTISVEGDYLAVQDLLENLEEIPRSYLVSSLTLGTGATAQTFTATITGDMFVMPPAPEPDLPDAP